MKKVLKKTVVTGLALAMIAGGSTSVFADGKGKGHDRDDDKRDYKYEYNRGVKFDQKSLINVSNSKNVNIIINFSDVVGGDVEWAIKHIASLAAKRVFEGYEDGTFKPRNTVSRIEAITAAVRLMGLRDQAESQAEMSTDLNFKDADKIEEKYPWAVGYVAVALENDLFTESDTTVQPEKAADRLWATTLLVKALKLDAEAKAKMNTKLPFRDANQIPAGSVGYVAVAVEKGLIDGFEDNTFRPNAPVTRAQLAKLLDRTGDQMPDHDQNTVTGTVAAAVSNNVLLVNKNGVNTPVTLDPNAFVFRGGVRVPATEIKVGDEVRIKLYNNIAIFVEVTKQAPTAPVVDFTVSGRLYSLEWNQGKIAKVGVNTAVYGSTTPNVSYYNVDPNYTIVGNAAQLVYDHEIELKGRNQVVTTIVVK